MREENLLTSYLAELSQQNWDIERYLAERTDLPETVQGMLRAAARLHSAPRPVPSAAFRRGSSQRLAAAMAARRLEVPTSRRAKLFALPRWSPPRLRALALPTAAALALMIGFSGAWTTSAAALPGTPFYPAKLTAEQVQLVLATTPELQARVQLQIAAARLSEAQAEMSDGNQAAVPSLLERYQQAIAKAQAQTANIPSPDSRQQIAHEISTLNAADHKITPRVTDKSNSHVEPTVQPKVVSVGPTDVSKKSIALAPTGPGSLEATASPIQTMATVAAKHQDKPPATATAASEATTGSSNKGSILNPTLKTLVAEALSGNDSSATAAAQAYIKQLQTSPGHAAKGSDLQSQRTELEHALQSAPPATRHAILLAISALDAAVNSGSTAHAIAAASDKATSSTDHAVVADQGKHPVLQKIEEKKNSSSAPTSNGGGSSDQSGKSAATQDQNNQDHPGGSASSHLGESGSGTNHQDGAQPSSASPSQSKAGPDSGNGGSQSSASGSDHSPKSTDGSASSNGSSSANDSQHPLIQAIRSVIKRHKQSSQDASRSPTNSSSSANQPQQ